MDFGRLSILVLLASQVSCQISFMRNFDPQDCIIEGTVVTLTCRVEDRNNGSVATIISGSQVIFNCSSDNTVEDNRLYLLHSQMESATAVCGDVSGQLVEVQNDVYIAQINITTTIALNGGYVECTELGNGIQDIEEIQLANITALPDPPTLYVEFLSQDATFFINWNNEGGIPILHYFTDVIGEDCGTCDHLGMVSNVTNQLSCTGWEPNGQVCNVTVTAATASACGLQQLSSSRLVYLQVPEVPILEVVPVYSYNSEELQSMDILLTVDSTVDPNDLPINFQVNVERSCRNDLQKCSFNVSAYSECIAHASLVKYLCRIDFAVIISSCPLLLLQQEQEADYQIGIFAQNNIGRSSQITFHVLSYTNLKVQLLFSESQHALSISFQQVHVRVTAVLQYGIDFQALDNQTTLIGFNVKALVFPISIVDKARCTITTNSSIVIQGSFNSNSSVTANQFQNDIVSATLISVILLLAGMITITIIVLYYYALKRVKPRQRKWSVSSKKEEHSLNVVSNKLAINNNSTNKPRHASC